MPRATDPPEVSKTLADLIGERAAETPERAAYLTGDARLSWAEYDALSQRLARLLLSLGFECGERVTRFASPVDPGWSVARNTRAVACRSSSTTCASRVSRFAPAW
jgi:non-ribosomal peptide synthetase component F